MSDINRELLRNTRLSEYERAEKTAKAINENKEIENRDNVKNPSVFGMAASLLEQGIHKIHKQFVSDPKKIAELEHKEKVQEKARAAMMKNYTLSNAINDAVDVALVVGTVATVATGVGAVGLGVRAAASVLRAGATQAARKGGLNTIVQAAKHSARSIENPLIKESLTKALNKGIDAVTGHNKAGIAAWVGRNIYAPAKATAHLVAKHWKGGLLIGGIPAATATSYALGKNDLNYAVREVNRNDKALEAGKKIKEKNGKVTVEDILDSKEGRRPVNQKHGVEKDVNKTLNQMNKQKHDKVPTTKEERLKQEKSIEQMIKEKNHVHQKSSLISKTDNTNKNDKSNNKKISNDDIKKQTKDIEKMLEQKNNLHKRSSLMGPQAHNKSNTLSNISNFGSLATIDHKTDKIKLG